MIENKEIADFPSNSMKKAAESEQKTEKETSDKKVQKIVTGTVKKQKPSFGKKLAGRICEDNTKSVGDYILNDVCIPAAKDLISDAVGGGIDMFLFGGSRRRNPRSLQNPLARTSHTNYGNFSSGRSNNRGRDNRPQTRDISNRARAKHDFYEVVIADRGEAQAVLSQLTDLAFDYPAATVADFYDLVGISGAYTDGNWGWYDLQGVQVIRAHGGGYIIDLPKPQPLV